MTTFTSSLPDELLQRLDEYSKKLKLPKNKIIEKSLMLYMEALERQLYIKSYKRLDGDTEVLSIVEEDMTDYYSQMEDHA